MCKGIFCSLALLISCSIFASPKDTDKIVAIEVPEDFKFDDKGAQKHRTYMEAYLQGCLDSKFPNSGVVVVVRHGDVILTRLPKDQDRAKRIESYVRNFVANSLMDGVMGLNVVIEHADNAPDVVKNSGHNGMWLPQSTVLFPSQVANPRQVSFSGGIRLRDAIGGQVSTPVSFGDQFPLYRWSNVEILKRKGDLQFEVEGAVFAIFNQTKDSSPLINADYYVAVPLSYAYDNWAYRLRLYHISSHLGDEYLKYKDHAKRLNKSYEAIDFFTAYTINKQVLLYGGPGVIVHSDSEMHLKPLYLQYGMEVRLFRHEFKQLYGVPYIAMHVENWQDNDWKIDATFALGYEWGKINGMGKKIRLSIEYHNGYCDAGQFTRIRDDYVQFRLSYGF